MQKWVCLFLLFAGSWFTLNSQNVVQNITESTTITPNETTTETLKKIKHGDRHLFRNGTTRPKKHKKPHDQMSLRMVATVCVTPNDDEGFCMPLKNCTKLMNQLENKNARKFLRESKCGPKNENASNPRVCCGNYDNYRHLATQDDIFPKNCGQHNVTIRSRILGGRAAVLGEFPWMARLIHKSPHKVKTFGCSGFLIAPKFVMTAAHCLKSDNINILGPIFEVQLGEHNTETKIDCNSKNTTCADPPQVIRIKKNIIHPNYNASSIDHHNDIGLIHLKKAATFTKYVIPICVVQNFDFKPFEYWISGWGSTKTRNLSPIKMKLLLPPYPNSNCTEKYKLINIKVADNQICAGGRKNQDSCTGDSGGPLMMAKGNSWFAAGIVSFGLGCGREGWPGIYTNVTSYLPWIQKTILKRVTNKTR